MILLACMSVVFSSCGTVENEVVVASSPPPPETATVQDPGEVKYHPSDEPLKLGMEYFSRGQYGIAQRYYRDAVEKAPKDVTAWIGLAASYDRLRRFDLADQAYKRAIALGGETVQLLNNQGYSYMLRGDLTKARLKFQKAYELDPTNATIVNNLQLLDSSRKFIQRTPE
jgi:Flp pilus assembly protein TadD